MKKIVIVTDVWCKDINGVATSIIYTKKELEKRGYKVSVIHPKLFPNMRLPRHRELRLVLFAKGKMENLLKGKKPDYIHIATEGTLGLSARSACIKNKWKFTTFYHTRMPEYIAIRVGGLKKTTYSYMRWFHSKAEKTMVSTSSLKKQLEKMKFKNVVVCPLGVDLSLFRKNGKAKLSKNLIKPVFVFLGRLAPEKNLRTFLKCKLPGSKLIIGDGPEKKKLEKEFKNKALFVGYKKGQQIVDLLSISDVFVFPSRTETFGLVALEALACGLPVAGYNAHGLKDIVTNGVDGFLGSDLKSNITKCLKLDTKNCRKKAAKFTWKKFVSKFIRNLSHV